MPGVLSAGISLPFILFVPRYVLLAAVLLHDFFFLCTVLVRSRPVEACGLTTGCHTTMSSCDQFTNSNTYLNACQHSLPCALELRKTVDVNGLWFNAASVPAGRMSGY